MKRSLLLLAASSVSFIAMHAADSKIATGAVNALGVDLYRTHATGEDNLLLSPFSIQNALAMTFAGADGDTRKEMQRALHFPADENALHDSFSALARELSDASAQSIERVKAAEKFGGPGTPFEFNLANRLFAQRGYEFRPPFLNLLKERYAAPLEEMDFKAEPDQARAAINRWVEEQTKDRIRDLIPAGAIHPGTRLTLVNALYLRAAWRKKFNERLTRDERFLVHGRDAAEVPTMQSQTECGYAKHKGFQLVTRFYNGDLQFVIALPDDPGRLASLEKALTPKLLDECAHLPVRKVFLHLPKFRLTPPTLPLGENLQKLGMKTAFNDPAGSANFDRMAPRTPDDYLYIGAVLHKTFLALDEKGAEAAAATAGLVLLLDGGPPKQKPVEVRVDHPFVFAIQHVPSGACLFLGRVTDPR